MRSISRRRALQIGILSPVLALLGVKAMDTIGSKPAVKMKAQSTDIEEKLVDSQPDIQRGAGTIWGYLINGPEADRSVNWSVWPTINNKSPPSIADFSEWSGVIVVGIPEPGYEIQETDAPSFDGDEITHTYTFEKTERAPSSSGLSFHYDFIKWQLHGAPSPETVTIEQQ